MLRNYLATKQSYHILPHLWKIPVSRPAQANLPRRLFWSRAKPSIIRNSAMAIRYQAVKQSGPFEAAKVPLEKLADDEVMVKVKAIALNPLECKQL